MTKRLVWITLVGMVFLSGCATARLAGPSLPPSLSAQRVRVGSTAYLPSSALAQGLNGLEHWDPEVQVWSLQVGRHELRAAPEMTVALVDGSAHPLPAAALAQNGGLLLPEQIWREGALSRWRVEERTGPAMAAGARRLRTIVVDAGHGGHDPGAIGPGGLREKSVTLDIARRLRDLLVQDGFRVVMTRYDDRFIPLTGRTAIANRQTGDLFVSVHANASRRRSVAGFEAYYLSEAMDDHARALEAVENAELPEEVGSHVPPETRAILWDLLYTEHRAESLELAGQVCHGLSVSGLSSRNRGVKTARFAVLKGARMPAVLVEVGFITHSGEEGRLRSWGHRQRVAEGIRQGILRFREDVEERYAFAR